MSQKGNPYKHGFWINIRMRIKRIIDKILKK